MTYYAIVLLLLFFMLPAEAGHKSMVQSQSQLCHDPQQPASLRCAPAPSATFDKQGRLWVVWSSGGHLYVKFSVDQGKTFSAAHVVNSVPEAISAHGENRPKIVLSEQGKIYLSWTTPLAKRYTGNVRFSYSNDNGLTFSTPITVNDNLDMTGHRFDALAVNKQGTVFMAWLDKRDRLQAKRKGESYKGAALYYSLSTDGGHSFAKNQRLMSHTCECCRVAMAIDKDNLPVILWRNIYDVNTRDHSLIKLRDNHRASKAVRVSFDNWQVDACPHHGPALSISQMIDGASEQEKKHSFYHLVWFNNAPERHGLFYKRMSDPNVLISDSKEFGELENGLAIPFGDYNKNASHPDVLSLDHQVWLVWKEFNGEADEVKLQYSDDNGETWQASVVIAITKKGSDHPFLLNDKNMIYLQWQTEAEGFRILPLKSYTQN